MSAPGHCRHCVNRTQCPKDCLTHYGGHVEWPEGHCPACDEADRITTECRRRAEDLFEGAGLVGVARRTQHLHGHRQLRRG